MFLSVHYIYLISCTHVERIVVVRGESCHPNFIIKPICSACVFMLYVVIHEWYNKVWTHQLKTVLRLLWNNVNFVCLQLLSSLFYLLNSNLDISSLVRCFNFDDVYNPDKSESDLVSDIKNSHNNYTEIASPPADGPVCLWRSYSGSTITLKPFHNKNSAGHLNTVMNLEASGLPLEWEWDTSSTGANMIFFFIGMSTKLCCWFLEVDWISPVTAHMCLYGNFNPHITLWSRFLTEKMVIDINARPPAGNVCL